MSLIRRQVFPLFALGIALAIGIALGSGPLTGDDASGSPAGLEDDNAELADRVAALEAGGVFDESVADAASAGWLDGQLKDASVTLVIFPGTDESRVAAASAAIEQAGAQTAVVARLSDDLLEPGKKTYVSSVAASSADGLDDLGNIPEGESYTQIGALIARAYVAHAADGIVVDDESTTIDSELQGAKLVVLDDDLKRRGSLTVVLAPGDHGDDVSTEAAMSISTAIVHGLVAGSDATVLVTPPTGTAPGGLIETLAADAELAEAALSTLNVSDGPNAQVAMVFGLSAAVDGKPGAFGTDGTSVVLPPGMTRIAE